MIRILACIALRAGVLVGLLWVLGLTIRWATGLDLMFPIVVLACVLTAMQLGVTIAIPIVLRPKRQVADR